MAFLLTVFYLFILYTGFLSVILALTAKPGTDTHFVVQSLLSGMSPMTTQGMSEDSDSDDGYDSDESFFDEIGGTGGNRRASICSDTCDHTPDCGIDEDVCHTAVCSGSGDDHTDIEEDNEGSMPVKVLLKRRRTDAYGE